MPEESRRQKREKPAVEPLSYSIPDAATALSVSPRSIYNFIEIGKLRKVKVGRRTTIPASDVRALAEGVV